MAASFLTVALCAAAAAAASVPEQVFITATGKAGEMAVSWVTQTAAAADETVLFGASPSSLTQTATGSSEVLSQLMDTPIRIHVATLTGLPDNATVFYAPGGGAGGTFSFVSAPARPGGTEYAIFGDLGLADDFSRESRWGGRLAVFFRGRDFSAGVKHPLFLPLSFPSCMAVDALIAEANSSAFDALIFAGTLHVALARAREESYGIRTRRLAENLPFPLLLPLLLPPLFLFS